MLMIAASSPSQAKSRSFAAPYDCIVP